MKIAQVIHSFPNYNVAGTEVYTYNLTKKLAERNKVDIFCRINDPNIKEYELIKENYNGLSIYTINNTFKDYISFKQTYKNDYIAEKFGKFLDETTPDIIHIQHLMFLSVSIIEEIEKRNIPVVFTLHDYWLFCPQSQLLRSNMVDCKEYNYLECTDCVAHQLIINKGLIRSYRSLHKIIPVQVLHLFKQGCLSYVKSITLFQKKTSGQIKQRLEYIKEVCEKVNLFIAPSVFIKKKFLDFGISTDRIIISRYGINRNPFVNSYKKKSDKLRFAYIGTLLPHKGVHVMIKAFNRIKHDRVELSIYGKLYPYAGFEYYPNYLKKLAKNRNIRFMGGFDNNDISDIFANIDVLIVPSIWPENSPLVIQEAFLARTPVIASDIGGIPELVKHNINGLLFRANEPNDLYDKIKLIIDNPSDIEKLKQSFPVIKSIEENARELEKLYHILV